MEELTAAICSFVWTNECHVGSPLASRMEDLQRVQDSSKHTLVCLAKPEQPQTLFFWFVWPLRGYVFACFELCKYKIVFAHVGIR